MPNKKYTPEDLAAALDEIKDKKMSVYKAAQVYHIPEQTLRNKIKNIYTQQDAPGKPTVLTTTEEDLLVKWVKRLADTGFPITKHQLIFSVTKLVKELGRENTFKDGVPGRHWYEGFLKRHPEISQRVAQVLTTARVAATEEKIRAWFARVSKYLEENNLLEILEDPTRIFNCDESAFFLCPKGLGVLTSKGTKTVYVTSGNNEKENLTLSLGASASGKLMPIFALFPYKRMQKHILDKYPKDWAIGKSDNGWMTCQTFYEYIVNVFYPFLVKEKIKLPVILFIDGHSSHLSLVLSEFCKDKGIILIALLPNSTHIMQPMDVAVFRPLKTAWKNAVHDWRMQNNGNRLGRDDFAPLLSTCIEAVTVETVQQGFRACGLYPFNPNAPDYQRLVASTNKSTNDLTSAAGNSNVPLKSTVDNEFLQKFNEHLGPLKVESFEKCVDSVWTGDVKDENLFHLWRKLNKNSENRIMTVENDLSISVDTLAANNILDTSSELHVSDLMNIDNNSFAEFVVQSDGSLVTSTPKGCPSSTAVEEVRTSATPNETNSTHNTEDDVAKSTCTPKKNETDDSRKADFPTPFKNALLWPETPKTSQPRNNVKRVIPTVAIAEDFIEHQRRMDEMKKMKQEQVLERKRKRELNQKNETQRKPMSKRGRKISADENVTPNIEIASSESIAVGDFVLIVYEEEKFPGVVLKIFREKSQLKYEVSTMQMSGKNWRWPEKKDVLVYDAADVLKKLKPPELCNNRGVYAFENFNCSN